MRTCLVISVIVHAAVMLWLVLAPGAKTFNPANAEPIMVELLPPREVAHEAEPPKSEVSKSEVSKSEAPKSEPAKSEPSRSAAGKPPKPEASQKPAKSNSKVEAEAEDNLEERAAAAARLAWMLNLPTETSVSLSAPPSESKSNLASEEIARLKAQVSKCWVAPAGVPSAPGFDVLLRIALNPDGTLVAAPALIRAPASLAGPLLVESAKRALQQCQPYGALPADKYKDWKILDMSFTAEGPSGLSGPPAGTR
jgi:hypothetical protein